MWIFIHFSKSSPEEQAELLLACLPMLQMRRSSESINYLEKVTEPITGRVKNSTSFHLTMTLLPEGQVKPKNQILTNTEKAGIQNWITLKDHHNFDLSIIYILPDA